MNLVFGSSLPKETCGAFALRLGRLGTPIIPRFFKRAVGKGGGEKKKKGWVRHS
jgi:hypothetical protein